MPVTSGFWVGQIVYILDQVRAIEDELLETLQLQGLDIKPQIVVVSTTFQLIILMEYPHYVFCLVVMSKCEESETYVSVQKFVNEVNCQIDSLRFHVWMDICS